jgi:DUF4097 and DUF4098 domain-containing protein YvlB
MLAARAAAVLLACAGLFSTACQLNFTHGEEARDVWKRSYPLAANGHFEIKETSGRIKIEAVAGETIEVVADRIVKAPTQEAAKEALSKFTINEDVASDRVVLDSTPRGLTIANGVSRRVDYVIKVPKSANVTLNTTNGEIEVTNVGGRFRAVSTNGRIVASGLGKGAEIETTNGVITLDVSGLGDGVRAEATNGVIDVSLPKDAGADLSMRTSNGSLSVEDLNVKIAEQSRRRLDGSIGSGGPAVRLETTNGAIRVHARQ